jgi:hypothetical protein
LSGLSPNSQTSPLPTARKQIVCRSLAFETGHCTSGWRTYLAWISFNPTLAHPNREALYKFGPKKQKMMKRVIWIPPFCAKRSVDTRHLARIQARPRASKGQTLHDFIQFSVLPKIEPRNEAAQVSLDFANGRWTPTITNRVPKLAPVRPASPSALKFKPLLASHPATAFGADPIQDVGNHFCSWLKAIQRDR